jgi:hypothetical protein
MKAETQIGINQKDDISERKPEVSSYIDYWKRRLRIQHYQIKLERISEDQVVNEELLQGHEYVGISIDNIKPRAKLIHTRDLEEDDIVHELVHIEEFVYTGHIKSQDLHYQTVERTEYLLKSKTKGGENNVSKIL